MQGVEEKPSQHDCIVAVICFYYTAHDRLQEQEQEQVVGGSARKRWKLACLFVLFPSRFFSVFLRLGLLPPRDGIVLPPWKCIYLRLIKSNKRKQERLVKQTGPGGEMWLRAFDCPTGRMSGWVGAEAGGAGNKQNYYFLSRAPG